MNVLQGAVILASGHWSLITRSGMVRMFEGWLENGNHFENHPQHFLIFYLIMEIDFARSVQP
jgi:hypothetical protein